MASARDQWLRAVPLKTWKRDGRQAVHKPLLTLLLIARAQGGQGGLVAFREIENQLEALLREFGPPRKSYHPEYPFWHLQSDGIWEVRDASSFPKRKAGHSPSRGTLRTRDAVGFVPPALWDGLAEDPHLQREMAQRLLDDFWPPTLHERIRREVGLSGAVRQRETVSRSLRDPRFRQLVLEAYEGRCAMCGYDARIGDSPLGVEAAHIKWHCYEGPDDVANALALCSLHHVGLDSGALGLTSERRIAVSERVSGGELARSLFHDAAGRPLRAPRPGMPTPAEPFIRWHTRQVFRRFG